MIQFAERGYFDKLERLALFTDILAREVRENRQT